MGGDISLKGDTTPGPKGKVVLDNHKGEQNAVDLSVDGNWGYTPDVQTENNEAH